MKLIKLEDALHKRPFKPFQIHMNSGDRIAVKHPEVIAFSPSKNTAVIWEGDHFHIVDIAHIGSLSFSKVTSKNGSAS
ncbi:MAG: hypothetical protein ABI042_10680 [Verrucomicrobiota bacterium]